MTELEELKIKYDSKVKEWKNQMKTIDEYQNKFKKLKSDYDELNDFKNSQCAKLLIQLDSLKMCVNCINSDFTGCNLIQCNKKKCKLPYNAKCEHWEMLKHES